MGRAVRARRAVGVSRAVGIRRTIGIGGAVGIRRTIGGGGFPRGKFLRGGRVLCPDGKGCIFRAPPGGAGVCFSCCICSVLCVDFISLYHNGRDLSTKTGAQTKISRPAALPSPTEGAGADAPPYRRGRAPPPREPPPETGRKRAATPPPPARPPARAAPRRPASCATAREANIQPPVRGRKAPAASMTPGVRYPTNRPQAAAQNRAGRSAESAAAT